MGTNYYAVRTLAQPKKCSCCGEMTIKTERLHIGKSSGGWCFSVHVADPADRHPIAEQPILPHSWKEWKILLQSPGWEIVSEDEAPLSYTEMFSVVESRNGGSVPTKKELARYGGRHYEKPLEYDKKTNCLRHPVDGRHCIANGEGPWDLIIGEFS